MWLLLRQWQKYFLPSPYQWQKKWTFLKLCFGKNSQLSAVAYVEVVIVAVEICPLTAKSLAVTS